MGLRNSGQPYHNKQYNMKAIQVNGVIKKFASLPKVWTDENGTHLNITDGEAYGFYDLITPDYNSAIQVLGDIEWDGTNFTYPVIDRTWSQTLAELKEQKIANLKHLYNRKLAETDWYVVREAETGVVTPDSLKYERADLRNSANDKEAEINALTTKKAVASYSLPNLD